jgi:tRNA(Ile)-lysidine synthetase-like protein
MDLSRYDNLKRLICACSGGADSMVLAYFLKNLPLETEIHVLIVNHNLRNCSTKEAQKTQETLIKNGFKRVQILEWNHPEITSKIEEKARMARQELIFKYAILNQIDTIFMGHNFNDLVENFFLKFGMGASLFGLVSLKKEKIFRKFGHYFTIARPLLDMEKSEVLSIAKEQNIAFSEDETNSSDAFKRNRLRKKLADFEVSREQFLNTIKNLEDAERIIKNNLLKIFQEKIIFNQDFGFFACEVMQLQTILKEELLLCFKQIIFYFTEKCEVRTSELETAFNKIIQNKGFTIGVVEIFFNNGRIFFIKEYSKINNEIKHDIWDLRFKILKEADFLLPKIPFKIIKTLPFWQKNIEKRYFLKYRVEVVKFEII